MQRYSIDANEREDSWDVTCNGRLVFACETRAQAEALRDELNNASGVERPDTVERIRAESVSLRMRLLGMGSSTDDEEVHQAKQYLYIAHALLQQVECNLILADYAMRKAVQ